MKGLSHWLRTVISCWMSSTSSSASSRSIIFIATFCCVWLSMPLKTSPNDPFPILSSLVNSFSGSTFKFYKRKKKLMRSTLVICRLKTLKNLEFEMLVIFSRKIVNHKLWVHTKNLGTQIVQNKHYGSHTVGVDMATMPVNWTCFTSHLTPYAHFRQ